MVDQNAEKLAGSLFALKQGVVSAQERAELDEELFSAQAVPAGLVHWDKDDGLDTSVRRADTRTLAADHWLPQRMEAAVRELNDRLWGMDILVTESVQILDYGQQGHYHWHFDVLPSAKAEDREEWQGTNRILTALVNLTDESEYTLGDLLLADPLAGVRSPGFHGCGHMIVFPSWHWHRATAVTSGSRRVAVMWLRGRQNAPPNSTMRQFVESLEKPAQPATANTDTAAIEVEEGLLVYRPYSTSLHFLDSFAGWIWEARAQNFSAEAIVGHIAEESGRPADAVDKDISTLEDLWTAADVAPTVGARIHRSIPSNYKARIALCRVTGSVVAIQTTDEEVAELLQPLVEPLAMDSNTPASSVIEVRRYDDQFGIRVDGGSHGIVFSPTEAVSCVFNEILSLGLTAGGCAAALGAGAIGLDDSAMLFPGLTNRGRAGLLRALSEALNAPIIATSHLPWYRGDGCVESLPLPLKLRTDDRRFFDCATESLIPIHNYGSRTDNYALVPVTRSAPNDGRRYRIRRIVYARYEPGSALRLERVTAADSLVRLMQSGSFFVHDTQAGDIPMLYSHIFHAESYQLDFDDISEAVTALGTLAENL